MHPSTISLPPRYTHYRSDGSIVDDWNYLDRHGATGVGQYDATWPRIEAEWYTSLSGPAEKVEHGGGGARTNTSFAVQFNGPLGRITFPNVANFPDSGGGLLLVGGSGLGGGTIVMTSDSSGERILATCHWPKDDPLVTRVSCPITLSQAVGAVVTGVAFRFERGSAAGDEWGGTSGGGDGGGDTVNAGNARMDWWNLQDTSLE